MDRAQNESESRRLKTDIKRLQDTIQNQKTSSFKRNHHHSTSLPSTETHNHHEINRLNHEIASLKESYKSLEEKYQVSDFYTSFFYSIVL